MLNRHAAMLALASLLSLCASARGATEIPVGATKPAAEAGATDPASASTAIVLPANTVIELEMVDSISSKTSKPGDLFRLKVALPVMVNGVEAIPQGVPVVGQVVHAQKARGGGKAGELILAARYVELPHGQIKLRSGFGAAGKNRTGAALATSIAIGVFGMLVRGQELELPAGHALSARVAADTPIQTTP
jgi:hypothetical protein